MLSSDRMSMLRRCVAALDVEISTIESGKADQLLQYYGSYAVPEEFVEACAGIKFPPPLYPPATPALQSSSFGSSSEQWTQQKSKSMKSQYVHAIKDSRHDSTADVVKTKADRASEPISSVLGESPFALSFISNFQGNNLANDGANTQTAKSNAEIETKPPRNDIEAPSKPADQSNDSKTVRKASETGNVDKDLQSKRGDGNNRISNRDLNGSVIDALPKLSQSLAVHSSTETSKSVANPSKSLPRDKTDDHDNRTAISSANPSNEKGAVDESDHDPDDPDPSRRFATRKRKPSEILNKSSNASHEPPTTGNQEDAANKRATRTQKQLGVSTSDLPPSSDAVTISTRSANKRKFDTPDPDSKRYQRPK